MTIRAGATAHSAAIGNARPLHPVQAMNVAQTPGTSPALTRRRRRQMETRRVRLFRRSPLVLHPTRERFPARWKPVRVKKTRQTKNLEPRFDSIEEKALERHSSVPREMQSTTRFWYGCIRSRGGDSASDGIADCCCRCPSRWPPLSQVPSRLSD
jgi:hypothetical protein